MAAPSEGSKRSESTPAETVPEGTQQSAVSVPRLSHADKARPFLKWAGGKRQLLAQILSRFPSAFGTYHEPFVGGGAVFFAIAPSEAHLSDQNERLVRAYSGIKNSVDQVIEHLAVYKNEKEFYLAAREWNIDERSDAEVAAWLIFVNKTGFNGLYRVNASNKFNVPFGNNPRALLCDERNLRACAAALANATMHCEDFAQVAGRATAGDLVYFDPPYVPVSVTSYFTSYTAKGFGMADQIRLRDLALDLRRRGVHVVISNSSSSAVYDLYRDFTCIPVLASRLVNATTSGRGRVEELIIV